MYDLFKLGTFLLEQSVSILDTAERAGCADQQHRMEHNYQPFAESDLSGSAGSYLLNW